MLRRKLLSSAEHFTYKHKSKFFKYVCEENALWKNADNNWIQGIEHILATKTYSPIYLSNIILKIAAFHEHVKLMKIAKNKWDANEFNGPFRIACQNGKIRAMKVLKTWIIRKNDRFYRSIDGIEMALRGDQPAALLLLNKWSGMSFNELLELGIFLSRLSSVPAKINRLLGRRGMYLFDGSVRKA